MSAFNFFSFKSALSKRNYLISNAKNFEFKYMDCLNIIYIDNGKSVSLKSSCSKSQLRNLFKVLIEPLLICLIANFSCLTSPSTPPNSSFKNTSKLPGFVVSKETVVLRRWER